MIHTLLEWLKNGGNFLKNKYSGLLPKLAFFSLIIVLATYVWDKHFREHPSFQTNSSAVNSDDHKDSDEKKEITETFLRETNTNVLEAKSEKAYVKSVSYNKETGMPIYKMHIPKGKHLYDEEKMKEVSQDSNTDQYDQENENI